MPPPALVAALAATMLLLPAAILLTLRSCWQRAEAGTALVVFRAQSEPLVVLEGGALVLPIVHRAERMDIAIRMIDIDRRGTEGLSCRDGIRADVRARFFVRVNRSREDVLLVAQSLGCERASDTAALHELFTAKFSEGMKTVAARIPFESLLRERDTFRDEVLACIGRDLSGFVLDDLVFDIIEQTPVECLDPNNILDARGIRKIRELTAAAARPVVPTTEAKAPSTRAAKSTDAIQLHPTPALPDGPRSFAHGRLRLTLERWCLQLHCDEQRVFAFDLRERVQVQFGREGDRLQVVLQQGVDGYRCELELSSSAAEYLTALGAASPRDHRAALLERLPRVEARGFLVGGRDLVTLLAALSSGRLEWPIALPESV